MPNKQDNSTNSDSQNSSTNTTIENPFSSLNTAQTNNMRTITEGFSLDINKKPNND